MARNTFPIFAGEVRWKRRISTPWGNYAAGCSATRGWGVHSLEFGSLHCTIRRLWDHVDSVSRK